VRNEIDDAEGEAFGPEGEQEDGKAIRTRVVECKRQGGRSTFRPIPPRHAAPENGNQQHHPVEDEDNGKDRRSTRTGDRVAVERLEDERRLEDVERDDEERLRRDFGEAPKHESHRDQHHHRKEDITNRQRSHCFLPHGCGSEVM
jgi:hypothetical protein